MGADLLSSDDKGLWCQPGGFHVDPWSPVPVAVVTHAHADHARPGSGTYYCAAPGESLLRLRVQPDARIHPVPYGEPFTLGRTRLTFHPAGHVLGSAQVKVEHGDETWVVSGDYKTDPDPTCARFQPVPCDVFISEATFALPLYRWDPLQVVAREIAEWWRTNAEAGRASILCTYALGKAQRVLAELRAIANEPAFAWMLAEPVLLHGSVVALTDAYRHAGIPMLETVGATADDEAKGRRASFAGRLVIAPPSAAGTPWTRRFERGAGAATGFVSGWMRVRGIRRRRGYDAGFVLSDHADWPGLLNAIRATGARRVLPTHGYTDVLARFLREQGIDASPLRTGYATEEEE